MKIDCFFCIKIQKIKRDFLGFCRCCFYCLYSLAAFSAEVSIPFIIAELKPLCSISFNPEIVHPSGVVTLSISISGWFSRLSSKDAAPLAVCAAIGRASYG